MRRDDDSPADRIGRILGPTSRPEPVADEDGWPTEWPAEWPPGAPAPSPAPSPGPAPAAARWAVSGRAAIAAGVFALAVVGAVLFTLLGGSGPAVDVVPVRDPGPVSGGVGPATPPAAAPVGASADPSGEPAGSGTTAPTPTGQLRIYVLGQVQRPGVVSLAAGARVEDAVGAAGGATQRADLTVINLARRVVDGEQIFVPRPGEKIPAVEPGPAGGGAVGAGGAGAGGSDGAAGGPGDPGGATPGAPVDLNTATVADLDALPGVGPVIAGRIVAWRQQNRRFTSVDDLSEVQGIGDATMARLRPLVRV